jgi:dTDP-4-amino-4,6-dideoxygalactose transaminase
MLDLAAQYRSIKPEIDAAVVRVFESGRYVLGEEVAAFEREFAEFCGAAHAVAVNSGTSALQLALIAAGVGPGDEVVTVPFTFVATAAVIDYVGAVPVFVDIEPRTFTMNPAAVEDAITDRTRAVIPVHVFGQCADMDPIRAVAARHGLAVIEDAAQAHGARYRGLRAGIVGDFGCFSFYPTKNLGAAGEGGIVVTDDERGAEQIRALRNWGERAKYEHAVRAFNMRMDALQAAVLRVKLRHLDEWTNRRRRIAQRYDEALDGIGLQLPREMEYARHVYHLYTVRVRERDGLQKLLAADGIATGVHYPIPIHLQPAWADLGYAAGAFPEAERAAGDVLSLPLYPEMTDEQVETVVSSVRRAVASPALSSVERVR